MAEYHFVKVIDGIPQRKSDFGYAMDFEELDDDEIKEILVDFMRFVDDLTP